MRTLDDDYEHLSIRVTDHDRVVRIDLDHASSHNIVDLDLIVELNDALRRADNDDGIDGMILGSADDEVFSAGGNLTQLLDADQQYVNRLLAGYNDTVELMWSTGKPIVAAVSGVCVAGGNELIMGCDMIIAGEEARFGQPESKVGTTATAGGVQLMPLMVGMQRAKELLLTSRILSAEEALDWGLINRVVPDGEVDEAAFDVVADIVDGRSPYSYRIMKAIFKRWYNIGMRDEAVDQQLTAAVLTNEEFRSRGQAFLADEDYEPRDFVGTTQPLLEPEDED